VDSSSPGAGGVTYVAVQLTRPTLYRAELTGVYVGAVVEFEDRSAGWYCSVRDRPGGGEALSLAEAKAALEARLRTANSGTA
jgi:hypothetical protein